MTDRVGKSKFNIDDVVNYTWNGQNAIGLVESITHSKILVRTGHEYHWIAKSQARVIK